MLNNNTANIGRIVRKPCVRTKTLLVVAVVDPRTETSLLSSVYAGPLVITRAAGEHYCSEGMKFPSKPAKVDRTSTMVLLLSVPELPVLQTLLQ